MVNYSGLSVLAAVLLSGCAQMAKMGEYYVVDPALSHPTLPDDKANETMYDDKKKQINPASPAFKTAYDAAKTSKESRNELLSRIMLISDDLCEQHKGDILSTATNINVGFGTLTNVFSGLGTVVGGMTAKAALAASAGVSNATRSLVNDEVYLKAYAINIVKAIDIDRETKKQAITSQWDKEPNQYGIDRGIRDVQEYHYACSFSNGLKIISGALDRRTPSKDELLARIELLRAQFDTTSQMNIKALSDSDKEKINSENAKTLEAITELQKQLATAPQ